MQLSAGEGAALHPADLNNSNGVSPYVPTLVTEQGARFGNRPAGHAEFSPSPRLGIGGSAGLGCDRAVIGLGDEESAVMLCCRDGLMPRLGLGRRQCGEDLLLVALDAL